MCKTGGSTVMVRREKLKTLLAD